MESVRALVGEVAVWEDDPFVVEFGEDRGGEAEDGFRVREDWTTSVRRLISRFSRSSGLVDWISFQCWCGRSANAVRSSFASSSISLTSGNCRPSMSATVSS
jgi:hypothetical protein